MNAEAIQEMSKSELVEKVLATGKRATALAHKHKATIRRVGIAFAGSATAAASGLICGAVEIKMPTLPKTKVRTDLAAAVAVTGLNAAGIFGDDGLAEVIQAGAYAAYGHGMGRIAEAALRKRGVK
jgi:hypothetical protein